MAQQKQKWPHTMQRGLLKGRTFRSQGEYDRALADLHERNGNGSGLSIRQVVDVYEVLADEGLSRTRAIEVLEALSAAGV